MIDVIIPAYNAHSTIDRTLSSIAYQTCVDYLNVYIVNDFSDKDYSESVKFFSNFMNIKEIKLDKNSGPGTARQYGIDNSEGKFIVFIDSDDVFSNCYAIEYLYKKIKQAKSDIVISSFTEETDDEFKVHNNSHIWLHGKMYRRSFIEKNSIHFNNERSNEDNGFNQLFLLCNPRISVIDYNTYIWCNNKKSLTRKNNHDFAITGFVGYVYNMNWAINEALKRKYNKKKLSLFSFSVLVATYHFYLKNYLNNNVIEQVLKYSAETLKITKKFPITEKEKIDVFKSQTVYDFDDKSIKYFLNPIILFDKFIELVEQSGDNKC